MASKNTILGIAEMEIFHFPALTEAFPPHSHEYPLIGTLLSGQRLMRYGAEETIIGAGELVLLPPFMPHSCQNFGKEASEWICAHLKAFPTEAFRPAIIRNSDLAVLFAGLARSIAGDGNIAALLKEISSAALALVNTLAQADSRKPAPQNPNAADPALCGNKYEYIRKYRRIYGITPYRNQLNSRINLARKLLETPLDLASCALQAGFCDQSHFSRSFKAAMGLTPGAYRSGLRSERC